MPPNTNELDFLEGRGDVRLTKNTSGNGVDAFPVTPSYTGRPSGSVKIPNYGNGNGSKPPRAPRSLNRMPHKPLEKQGIYGGATGLGGGSGSGSGSGSPGDDSNPDGPFLFDMGASNSNQCQDSQDRMIPQPKDKKKKKQKKKSVKIGTYLVKVSYDKNGNPVFTAIGENGRTAVFTYKQALAKYYHADVYNLEFPKGFDVDYVRVLQPKERIAYIEQTVPPKKILEFLKANVNSFVTENFRTVPGFIGARKDPGQLYINRETGQIHFINDMTNQWRTTVIEDVNGLKALAQGGFHLFPNAGK